MFGISSKMTKPASSGDGIETLSPSAVPFAREISACRICGNADLISVFDLGPMALTGVFPSSRREDPARLPLDLVKCCDRGRPDACGLVQLRHSFDLPLLFGNHYGYRSGLNAWMISHLAAIASDLRQRLPLSSPDIVLDIGSNDGTLLGAFLSTGAALVGMDPVGQKFARFYPPEAQLIDDFFSAARFLSATGGQRARLVTSVAMVYDLERPCEFASQVRDVLADDGIWFFEQSCLPAMLANTSYDTICHEHLEYYTLKQIHWMLRGAGFQIAAISFNAANGGSFAVVATPAGGPHAVNSSAVQEALRLEEEQDPGGLVALAAFRESSLRRRDELRGALHAAARRGARVLGYGASTKGNVILQFCGLTAADLLCIAEVNPDKYGCFTPGSAIPIVSELEARNLRPDSFLVLPWHFRDTIIAREAAFLAQGGCLLFPLPQFHLHRAEAPCLEGGSVACPG